MPASRPTLRTFLAVIATLAASPARAQSGGNPSVVPPSAILTNYDRVLIGQEEALESGAFVARVGDSTAVWYNPAGLALVDRSVIGASATGYELNTLDLGDIQATTGKVTLAQLPSYFGGVLGRDVLNSDAWRIGFAATKPTSWTAALNGAALTNVPIVYSSRVSISTLEPTLAASWRPVPAIRLGAGFGVAITSIYQTQILSVRSPLLDSNGSILRTVDASGVTWGILGTAGVQWDVTDRLVAGASLRTPTAKILATGSLSYASTTIQGTTSSQSYFRDSDASFDYKLPLDLNFGLAWREKRFDVEVDVRFHSGITPYTMLGSEEPVTTVATDASGATTTTTSPFPGITYGAHQVWNVALGGRYALDDSWSLHGGFYTDLAPADEDSGAIFRTVNLYGLTAGAKLKGSNLSGSLGIGLGWGRSEEFTLGDYGGASPVRTHLSIFSVSLLYAISYRF
jgi:long-subunit fatty acid transport protein